MSQGDPTDHTLAVIASIFERSEAKPTPQQAAPAGTPEPSSDPAASGDTDTHSDTHAADAPTAPSETPAADAGPTDISGYTKLGPGPLDSLRFRWTARLGEDGHYYVDETIGSNSLPISSGPMPQDSVIRFIDERARDAQQRFDALRRQIFDTPSERGHDGA